MFPFQALYGYAPPNREIVLQDVSTIAAVNEMLQGRTHMDTILHMQLETTRNRIKQIPDKDRSEREFQVEDWVYLKLQPINKQVYL